ncbi:uncharacterized protein LOC115791552 [Archocentrus centrarchus]|uniref:uncharacterized protein LOC115791552 n=1 Tax=Archocentrus centrarchus TaxID=63155 RepID=UPI0011EA03CE|nr:uncharacterized protein LOC115791552 [Archocentrus centrarchus]
MSYISELQVSLNKTEEYDLHGQGFTKIFVNLNKGAEGNTVYLWYKKGNTAITRIQISFNNEMTKGLMDAGFHKINKNLNEGTSGDQLYLWYYKGSLKYDVPITDLFVSTQGADEPKIYKQGWERLACDLNRRAGGNWIHLWLKREKPTYIQEIKATNEYAGDDDNFNEGYIRVDEDTNRGAGGPSVFIWYRQTTDPKEAITKMAISTNDDESKNLQSQGYQIVNRDLNEGTKGKEVYLWYKNDTSSPNTKAITLLINASAKQVYEKDGIKVINKNLNSGNHGVPMYLSYYQ